MSALLDTPRLTVRSSERDHVQGPATAPVTLVEYGDYECPFCGAAHRSCTSCSGGWATTCGSVPPLPAHPDPPPQRRRAEAAEAAGAQGRFWEMHDLLFENQQTPWTIRTSWRTRARWRSTWPRFAQRPRARDLRAAGPRGLHVAGCAAASTARPRSSSTASATTAARPAVDARRDQRRDPRRQPLGAQSDGDMDPVPRLKHRRGRCRNEPQQGSISASSDDEAGISKPAAEDPSEARARRGGSCELHRVVLRSGLRLGRHPALGAAA